MPRLFDGTPGIDDIIEILDQMRANCPQPSSTSKVLWDLRHATSGKLRSKEKLLEKAVAMLARNGHMRGWFNQCPVASGIGGPHSYRHSSVDLVHWEAGDGRLTLVELKWRSDTPTDAVRQVLRYGAAYLFCRIHQDKLPVGHSPTMSARHLALRVAAPARYFRDESVRDCLSRARESLDRVPERTGMLDLSMSLDILAFPEWFDRLPFSNGPEVRHSCDGPVLTEEGRIIVNAFDALTSVPASTAMGASG